jgi:hypothetical protein
VRKSNSKRCKIGLSRKLKNVEKFIKRKGEKLMIQNFGKIKS